MGHLQPHEIVDRILARCVKDGDCLVWQGSKTRAGYGQTRVKGKRVSVHRAIYEQWHGPIPDGLTIDHVKMRGCHSRACCNVDHFEVVTGRENTLRGDGYTAVNARKTHCPKGHLLAGDNLHPYFTRHGKRQCRICIVAKGRARALRPPTVSDGSEAWHGTCTGYTNHKCRCGRCRQAHSVYQKAYGPTRRERGLCWSCNTPVTDGRARCPKHLAMVAQASLQAHRRRRLRLLKEAS